MSAAVQDKRSNINFRTLKIIICKQYKMFSNTPLINQPQLNESLENLMETRETEKREGEGDATETGETCSSVFPVLFCGK